MTGGVFTGGADADEARASVLDALDAAVVATDPEYTITHVNRAAESLYGRRREEVVGRPISVLVKDPDADVHAEIARALATTGDWHGEADHVRKDGAAFPAFLQIRVLEGADGGRPLAFVGVIIDISRRVRVERELRSARDYLSAVTACMGEGLCTVDVDGRVAYVNPAAEEMLGWPADELRGRRFHEALHHRRPDGSPYPVAECPIAHARRAATVLRVQEDMFIRRDGSELPVEYTAAPIELGDGVRGSVLVFSDISERKRAEAERAGREPEIRLRQKLEAVGQLAAGIAHEINTPIQFVGDTVSFLQEAFTDVLALVEAQRAVCRAAEAGPVDRALLEHARAAEEYADIEYLRERVPPAFARAENGIEHVATIVRAMREFAHPSSAHKEPTDLNQAMRNTLVVATNAYKYVADVVTDLEPLPPVTCDSGDLNQVFLNLVVNAAQAIEEHVGESGTRGTITIRSRDRGDRVLVTVADTGGGIPAEIAPRVFDPFFTTKEVGRGTGQGLALARTMVVERHGGTLTFETEPGRGTTFHVDLPIEPVAPSRPMRAAA